MPQHRDRIGNPLAYDAQEIKETMCLLIVLHEVVPDWPLVVAANREENYDRLGEPPRLLCESPKVFGGCDRRAGGTWLAINPRSIVCAVTNRPRSDPPRRAVRSRGLLCLDAARQKSPIAIADVLARTLGTDEYDGFNLLGVAPAGGNLFYFDGRLREKPLCRGVFVVTTGDANDFSDERVRRAYEMIETHPPRQFAQWQERLEAICRDHGSGFGASNALCVHGEKRGTVSSAILAFHQSDSRRHLFRHCQGRSCEARYKTVAWPSGFFETVRAKNAPDADEFQETETNPDFLPGSPLA